ncbi:type IV secretory system conjugative DNA transfer family protein [Roseobacter sp. EG26]|uniref:type IV secretory system conjugative DNA transfer family protein n=1 Tax=Roseobacter sp. EG26 TaxID=3412477 RepID=UPI003CE551D1
MLGWGKTKDLGEIDPQGRRLLGVIPETNEPVWAPPGHASVFGANGAGKSTRVAVPAIFSYASTARERPVLVCDVKDGELAAQCTPMLHAMGIPVAVIDDFGTRPELSEFRVSLNPFGAMVSAYDSDPRDLAFASETIMETLIPEPPNDERNAYFRAWPRKMIDFACGYLLKRGSERCTPGAVAEIIADQDVLITFAEIEPEEGTPHLKSQAKAILAMQGHEHFGQHLESAQRALRLFAPGTRLNEVGAEADCSHADLIRRGGFIFLIGPQRFMERCGTYMGTNLMSFVDALYAGAGSLRILADEWTNFPAKALITRSTTLRAYGGELIMISQSPSEVVRKFGEHEAQTAEDNSITKQWLGFSNFKEAEKISKAIGEEHAVASALGSDNGGFKTNTNLSLIKQRHMTPADLMAMPKEQCLVHIKGIGFMVLNTVSQENIEPYCNLIADNPLEGGRLTPNPIIKLAVPGVAS